MDPDGKEPRWSRSGLLKTRFVCEYCFLGRPPRLADADCSEPAGSHFLDDRTAALLPPGRDFIGGVEAARGTVLGGRCHHALTVIWGLSARVVSVRSSGAQSGGLGWGRQQRAPPTSHMGAGGV